MATATKMTKAELVAQIAKTGDLTKTDAEAALAVVTGTLSSLLGKGKSVAIPGFGSFEVRKRAARTARNPQTGETIKVKARKVVAFKAAKSLKDDVA